MKKLLKTTLFLFCFCSAFAQETSSGVRDDLYKTGRMILEHPEYEVRDSANRYFASLLKEYVQTEEGFADPLEKVTNMMRLAPEGADFALYTWQMPDADFQYKQYGLVVAQTKRDIAVTVLEDVRTELEEPHYKVLKGGKWYGAVYYDIIPVKKGGDRLYTLLGFVPGEELNRKVIDVVEVDKRGRPEFGARIFRIEEFMDRIFTRAPMRLILSYSGDYAASVRWKEKERMIVMDQLAPPDPKMKGLYRVYGPNMSYDGLRWEDDWWVLEEGIKFNSDQNVPIVPPSKPVGPPANSSLSKSGK